MVDRTRPSYTGKIKPSYSTLKSVTYSVERYCQYYYSDSAEVWNSRCRLRLNTFLRNCTGPEGNSRLTTGIWRQRQWIGISVLSKLYNKWLKAALTEKTLS